MSISVKTRVSLWGRAAARCAFPECRRGLVIDASKTDALSLVGEACHIVAKEPIEPRGTSPLTPEQRDEYNNLILLCAVHHKVIDDLPNTYTVERLKLMKSEHEQWVRDSLREFDPEKQRDDELYAEYVEEWVLRANLDNWLAWSSWVLGAGWPRMSTAQDQKLENLRAWLFSRIWPEHYPELKASFMNFFCVLQDFQETFRKHAKKVGDGDEELWTEKFYQIPEWDPPRYNRRLLEWEFHVALVEDLMLELTRASNYICDRVRQFIDPTFRLREGLVIVGSGPHIDLTFRQYRLEYRGTERKLYPYPGLEQFKKDRKTRDLYFGKGVSVDDPEFQIVEETPPFPALPIQ